MVYAEVGRRYGSRLSVPQVGARFAVAFRRQEQLDEEALWRTSEAREQARWRCIVREVLDDVSDPAGCFAELYEHFGRPGAWRCEAEAARTLQTLAGQGCTVGLASNYDGRLRRVVSGLPQLAPTSRLVISSEVGWRKPAAQFFAALCQSVQLPPERILFVGDDPVNDYHGARAAGMPAILLDPQQEHSPPIERISTLVDLLE
jgi:putative hydrolase of the HAD superfamily